jgi:hypothetical protein
MRQEKKGLAESFRNPFKNKCREEDLNLHGDKPH